MNSKILLAGLAAAATLLMGSCINNDDPKDTIATENLSSALIYSVDNTTGATSALGTTSASFETNYTQLTQGVVINNLKLADGVTLPKAKFSGLKPQSNNTGWMISSAATVTPEVEGFPESMVPEFRNVRFSSINHTAELNGQTVLGAERAVSLTTGNYTYYLCCSQAWATGVTKVKSKADPTSQPFESTNSIYLISVNPSTSKATIQVYRAVFAPQMANLGLDIEFRDLPVTVDPAGRIHIDQAETFEPYYDKAPNPAFPISNLSCTWDPASGINIVFDCDAKGGSYNVSANMPFNYGMNVGS
ncbi:MAG: hypothetical protein K2F72_04615 [Muribaculaceae bacterium]|nr:hypothetical protein [Muribaculaceae bacterium]